MTVTALDSFVSFIYKFDLGQMKRIMQIKLVSWM